ncbi:unknown protein [Microcystis aeruginosa NIES-843]|uniref:Uncharacterized protein n=1 Tax=Microcystis aeruginosa (strain NIES-843 / IAM M-2473) TaxID=449447 RepID=B0JKX4_MICAN|nr:unknown protein [Microcystis aeruginosa NIES-843]
MFQSLIGFKINWNPVVIDAFRVKFRFQSLIGFKINWNLIIPRPLLVILGFNP